MSNELKFEVIDAPASDRKLPVVQGFKRGELVTQGPGDQFEAMRAIFDMPKELRTRATVDAEVARLVGGFLASPEADAFSDVTDEQVRGLIVDPFYRARQTGKSQMFQAMLEDALGMGLFIIHMEEARPRRMRGRFVHSHKGRARRQHKLRVSPLDQKDLSHDVFTRRAVVRYRNRDRT